MNSLAATERFWSATTAAVGAVLGPWLILAVRIWLAQAFLVAQVRDGMLNMQLRAPLGLGWWADTLHHLGTSNFGAIVQAICPVLLVVGLFARPAAAALIIEAVLMPPADADIAARAYWTLLLARILILGPGPLSCDWPLGRGAASSAVPGVARAHRVALWATRRLGPFFQLLLRLWVAAALAGAVGVFSLLSGNAGGSALPAAMHEVLSLHLPSMVLPKLSSPLAASTLALMFVSGTLTRAAAAFLLVQVPFAQIGGTSDLRLFWVLVLALIALFGPGSLSIDALMMRAIRRRAARAPVETTPHIVVVGSGFGGIAVVRGLAGVACRITLIDRRNHHVFQPLLYQVATAGLSPADIATPVRGMFRNQPSVRVLLGEVTGVDSAAKAVLLDHRRIPYDYLVVATGARHGYFGRDEWATFAPGLKTIEDGTAVRRRLLLAFEEAENAETDEDRRAWLTFLIVGGGPTGVELAGAIAELARFGLTQEFRRIDPSQAHVLLVQSGPRLLPAFPEVLSRDAERTLRGLGVDVLLDHRVEDIDARGAVVSGRSVPARTVLWAAGVMASPAAAWLGVKPDRSGRVPVGPNLEVAGCPNVFAVGDTALSASWKGRPAPGLAPAAKQSGAHAAKVIRARIAGRETPAPFRYRHLGSLATIGRQSAVADFGFIRFRGALAWWLWGAAHIAFLVGGRNRALVLMQWLWAYLTFRRGTRLITEPQPG